MRKKLVIIGLVVLLLVTLTPALTIAVERSSRSSGSTTDRIDEEDLRDSVRNMLTTMLKNPNADRSAKIYAIKGLANIKDIDEDELMVIGPLFDALVMETDPEVKKEISKALDKIFSGESGGQ